MSKLFNGDNSDSEDELKINTDYANNYNNWRQKEELNKFKTKYGEHLKDVQSSEDDSSSSSDEDEEGVALTEQLEKDFYKTLACLKNKDPKIYDEKVKFFNEEYNDETEARAAKKSKKEKKLLLRDYELQSLMTEGGKLSVDKAEVKTRAPTYEEEQEARKLIFDMDESDNEDEDLKGGLFISNPEKNADKSEEKNSTEHSKKGQKPHIESSEKAAFLSDPNLDSKDKFVHEYLAYKKYLGTNDEDYNHDDEDLSEDEKMLEKQEEFEHKYNFRFEEPDQEFIKTYPRTVQNSLRKKDTRRSEKRAEVRERKEKEKLRKKEELKQLKALKRKEIADKISKLKEITGNDDIQFDNIDLDADFDPEEHDRKMQQLFNDEYYAGPEGDVKPEFPEIDEELGIERNWDDYDPNNEELVPDEIDGNPHCEDSEFNMDADYDRTKTLQSELIDASRKKKKRRRSKFAEVIAAEKPKFDPTTHSSFREYIEQYYALDYEDMIDDMPCRFKYRNVMPNDYGLSVEEILMADNRELNQWCSLKKALEHKPEHIEKYEVRAYQQKAKDEAYKKKILKSLYRPEKEPKLDPEVAIIPPNPENEQSAKKKRKPKKKKKAIDVTSPEPKVQVDEPEAVSNNIPLNNDENSEEKAPQEKKKKNKKAKTGDLAVTSNKLHEVKKEVLKSPTDKSKKRKANQMTNQGEPQTKKIKSNNFPTAMKDNSHLSPKKLKKEKKNKSLNKDVAPNSPKKGNSSNTTKSVNVSKVVKNVKKKQSAKISGAMKHNLKKTAKEEDSQVDQCTSNRFQCYGITNPKKFKHKAKYVKQK